jgi:hypothetical protein
VVNLRLCALSLCAVVLLAACGSSDAASKKSEPDTSASPAATYFVQADTDAINKAAAPAQAAGTKAVSDTGIAGCNKLEAYPAWRKCWHSLLDPFSRGLTRLAATFTTLAANDLPEDCVTELEGAAETFGGFAGRVDGLLAGFDSDERSAQAKAAKRYGKTVQSIIDGFAKPFQDMTQVCYSPQDLESINASPSPSPTS